MTHDTNILLNDALVKDVTAHGSVTLSGSLYAVPSDKRQLAAAALSAQGCWVHCDIFAHQQPGITLEELTQLCAATTAFIDVHILHDQALTYLDMIIRQPVQRITIPFESVDDPAAIARRIRDAGISPWLAIAPSTPLTDCSEALPHFDGGLVMLIAPGTHDQADLNMLEKVERLADANIRAGVDGGVNAINLETVVNAGAHYLVVGRSLLKQEKENE